MEKILRSFYEWAKWEGILHHAKFIIIIYIYYLFYQNKKEITNMKRKLTIHKKEVEKMETAYKNDDVEDAADFLRKFSKSK